MKRRTTILLSFAMLLTMLISVRGFAASTGNQPVKLMLGCTNTALIKEDGNLWLWGSNDYGQLGDGTRIKKTTPQKVEGLSNVVDVCIQWDFTAALTSDGQLYTWGRNDKGQLGNGTTQRYIPNPVKIMDQVDSISLGQYFGAAVKKDGSLWIWGYNDCGQIGNGTSGGNPVVSPIPIMTDVSKVSLGYWSGAALKKDGSVWTWGDNYYGQSGNPATTEDMVTVPVQIMTGVKDIASGGTTCAAIKEDDSLWIWGDNELYETGLDTSSGKIEVPTKLANHVKAVALGGSHSAMVKQDGSLWMWGNNEYGQLGNGMENQVRVTPEKRMDDVIAVSLGNNHSGVIKADGSLWMWGSNYSGQLGNGTEVSRLMPIQVMEHLISKEDSPEINKDNPDTGNNQRVGTTAQKENKKQTIKAFSKIIVYGFRSVQVKAKASGGGKLTYKTGNPKVASVTSKGKLTSKGYGETVLYVKAAAKGVYQSVTKKITVKVVPKKIVIRKVTAEKNKAVSLSWKTDKTVTGYKIFICTKKDFKKGTYTKLIKKSQNKVIIKNAGLKRGNTYYVKMCSYKKIGKKYYFGAFSEIRKIRIR